MVSKSKKQATQYQSQDFYRGYALNFYRTTSRWGCEASKGAHWAAQYEAEDLCVAIQLTKLRVDRHLQQLMSDVDSPSPSCEQICEALNALREEGEESLKNLIDVLVEQSSLEVDLAALKQRLGCSTMTDIYVLFAQLGRAICDQGGFSPSHAVGPRDVYLNFVLKPEIHYKSHGNTRRLALHEQFYHALCNTQ